MLARLVDGLHTLQGYLVGDEERERVLQACRQGIMPPQVLTDFERELVAYAREQLDGTFHTDSLWAVFRKRISRAKLLDLAREWERRGWLTQIERGTNPQPRRLTPLLLAVHDGKPLDTLLQMTVETVQTMETPQTTAEITQMTAKAEQTTVQATADDRKRRKRP